METKENLNTGLPAKKLNMWSVYGICLFVSTVFFLLFGFNSPIYTFNSDNDYHWFMTMGNSFVNGKIPYRDLFEHKGPIVYLVYAFCCLFPNPGIVILMIEIISMSLFFFFAYRICIKYLNTFYSLIAIPLLAFTVFTCWCRMFSAATVEEFTLPIYAYFLLCWLEFLNYNKSWSWVRALCLGLCFGVILWVKYTLIYFMIVPMIIWLILNICRRQYRILLNNILFMIAGALIITLPIVCIFALLHALDDLFYVYFYINLTAYGTTAAKTTLYMFQTFFKIGPVLLIFILFGVTCFTIRHWKKRSGWLLLIAFLTTFILLTYSGKGIAYYYGELIPYAILGIMHALEFLNFKLNKAKYIELIYIGVVCICILLCIPCSVLTSEWGRKKEDYAPLVVADIIHKYEKQNNKNATIFCYKVGDIGVYNASGITPNNYFFAQNVFDQKRFPEMYNGYYETVTSQKSDFIIMLRSTWNKPKEQALLSQFYKPYTGDVETSTFTYNKIHYYYYANYDFILLIKK